MGSTFSDGRPPPRSRRSWRRRNSCIARCRHRRHATRPRARLPQKQCGGWCSVKEATHHCTWCKCAACDYCRPRERHARTRARAPAGGVRRVRGRRVPAVGRGLAPRRVALAVQARVRRGGAGVRVVRLLGGRRRRRRLCRLRAAAGEPFCKRGNWVSYWRVDLRDADDDDDGLDGWLDVDVGPSGGARRALVRGRQLIDSATGAVSASTASTSTSTTCASTTWGCCPTCCRRPRPPRRSLLA